MNLEARLNRLEKSNRRLKGVLSVVSVFVATFVIMGATPTRVIEVEKIILRDRSGVERGELFTTNKSVGIQLLNPNGKRGLVVMSGSSDNGILIYDQDENLRESLTTNIQGGSFAIHHPGSELPPIEMLDSGQGAALTFRSRASVSGLELGISPQGSAINVSDGAGTVRTSITGTDIGLATFSPKGELAWTPGFDLMSPEDQAKIRAAIKAAMP
jgi:hypothetical protein